MCIFRVVDGDFVDLSRRVRIVVGEDGMFVGSEESREAQATHARVMGLVGCGSTGDLIASRCSHGVGLKLVRHCVRLSRALA